MTGPAPLDKVRRYRLAAMRSLERGDGLDLLTKKEFEEWYQLFCMAGDGAPMEREEFCMSLCFLAAMAER